LERQKGERSRLEAEVGRLEGQEREADGNRCSVQEKVKQLEDLCQVCVLWFSTTFWRSSISTLSGKEEGRG